MKTLQALKFLFIGPMVMVLLTVINLMTWDGEWWIQWPALGIGIAWFISLFRVLTTMIAIGGLAAFIAYVRRTN